MEQSTARSRSRSREPDSRQLRHVLQAVPREMDLQLRGIYHFCTFSGTGIPRLAVLHALGILWSQGLRLQYRGGYHYENDNKCTKMSEAVNKRNPLQSQHRPDVSAFVRDVTGLSIRGQSKILTTIAAPCTKISQGILHGTNNLSEVGPHANPSSLFWTVHAGLVAASNTIPTKNNIVISEMVPAAMNNWEEQFTAAIGPPIELNALNGAERRRFYRTSPKVQHPITQAPTNTNKMGEMLDGSTWPATATSNGARPPTLRSIYPHLLERQALNHISAADSHTLKLFLLRNSNNTFRYAGPSHLAQWLELPDEVVSDIEAAYPCEQFPIDPIKKCTQHTWEQKGTAMDSSMFHRCGVKVLCKNCSEAAELLGRAWNFSTAVAIVTAVLRTAFQETETANFTAFNNMCQHYCTSPCQFVHTLEQAKGRAEVADHGTDFLERLPLCLI